MLIVAGCGGGSVAHEEIRSGSAPATLDSSPAPVNTAPRRPPHRIDPSGRTVRVEAGPFTDRVELAGLTLETGRRPLVQGRIRNAVDVSEVIILEIQADFYDSRGRYLGSGRQVFEDAAAGADEPPLRFAIRSDTAAAGVVAALLTVPQLVNE